MHENIRKWLNDCENAFTNYNADIQTKEDEDIMIYYTILFWREKCEAYYDLLANI